MNEKEKDLKRLERESFGRYLKGQMKERGLKTRDICEITGASQQAVSFWCNGKWMPTPERYAVLMDYLENSKKSK